MICTITKPGIDCFFMSKEGCKFNGGTCKPIIDKCEGCQKAQDFPAGRYCIIFPDPASKWRFGTCNMATHVKSANANTAQKVNPIKASKRSGK